MKTIVYYHNHCTDGFAAAFVVYKLLHDDPNVEYVPCNYDDAPPMAQDYEGKRVIIVDFSFPLPVLQDMQERAEHFTWLDHHKTAFEMLGLTTDVLHTVHTDKVDIILDNNRSGALLAFDWFFGRAQLGDVPRLIRHIDDRDRWQFKMSETRAVHAALQLIKPWSFEQWDKLDRSFFEDYSRFDHFVEKGEVALQVQEGHVLSAAKNATPCFITYEKNDGELVRVSGLAVNSTVHMSEVGHELAKQSGSFGLIYFIDQKGDAKCSLRSEGDYDVSIIAKHFGGGGHKNAAGFTASVKLLLQFLVR